MARIPSGEKGLWLAIVAGLVLSIFVYGVLVTAVVSIRDDGPPGDSVLLMRPIFYVLGVVALLVSATVFGRKASVPGLPVASFRVWSIVSLGVAELAAILGLVLFFMTRRFADFGVLAGATLALVFLYVVPGGLRYFAAQEREGSPPVTPG